MEEEDSGFPRREGSPSLPLFEVGSYSNFLETGKCRPNTTAIAQNTNGNLKKERAGLKGDNTGVHWYVHVYIKIFPIKNLIQDSSPSPGLHKRSQEFKWRVVKDREGKTLGTWGGHETLEKTENLKLGRGLRLQRTRPMSWDRRGKGR